MCAMLSFTHYLSLAVCDILGSIVLGECCSISEVGREGGGGKEGVRGREREE